MSAGDRVGARSFEIAPVPPYDFGLTADCMTYFQSRHAADVYEGGTLRRALWVNGKGALALIRDAGRDAGGGVDAPRLAVDVTGEGLADADFAEVERVLRRMLCADVDIAPFYDMARADAHLATLASNLYGLRLTLAPTAYEALILAILGQQISTHVARMLRELLIETYGGRMTIGGREYRAFPQPDAVAAAGVEGLRAIKFSGRKAEYICDISRLAASGELDLDGLAGLPSDEAVARLTALRGVGAWTAQWMLIRALGHTDGFPYGDLALQRMMGALVGDGARMSGEEALARSEVWRPWRSYVTTYLFGAGRAGRFGEWAGVGG